MKFPCYFMGFTLYFVYSYYWYGGECAARYRAEMPARIRNSLTHVLSSHMNTRSHNTIYTFLCFISPFFLHFTPFVVQTLSALTSPPLPLTSIHSFSNISFFRHSFIWICVALIFAVAFLNWFAAIRALSKANFIFIVHSSPHQTYPRERKTLYY